LVSAFDIVALELDRNAATIQAAATNATSSSADQLRGLKVIKLIRALRLVKLLRLLRGSRIFRRFQTKMSIRYSTLDLLKCGVYVIAAAHWSACCWGLIAAPLFVEDPMNTWLGSLGYCRSIADDPDPSVWVQERGEAMCVSTDSVYLAALYWAFLLVTNTGYSDMTFRSSSSPTEQLVSICIIAIAQTVWAQVLATFTGILISSDPHTRDFRHGMDQLNRFLGDQPYSVLSTSTRQRLREYYHQSRHIMIDHSNKQLIASMSPALQGEVAYKCNRAWLGRVSFLRHAEPSFMVALSLELVPMVFAPGEEPMMGYLYIIHRGLALHAGKVLSAGKVWGEDMILFSEELRSKSCAKAMNYLEVHMMGRDELLDIAILYPRTYRMLRRQIAFLALRRAIITRAKALLDLPRTGLLREERHSPGFKSKASAFKFDCALEKITAKTEQQQQEDEYRQKITRQMTFSGASMQGQMVNEALSFKPGRRAASPTCSSDAGASTATPASVLAGACTSAATRSDAQSSADNTMMEALLQSGSGGEVLRALVRGVESLRAEITQLRDEQQGHREMLASSIKQQRQRQRVNRVGAAMSFSTGGAPSSAAAGRSGTVSRPPRMGGAGSSVCGGSASRVGTAASTTWDPAMAATLSSALLHLDA
jgi:hypothetical protein